MMQIKYAFNDIFENTILNIVLAVQIIIIMMLVYFSVYEINSYYEGIDNLDNLTKSSAFVNSDQTSNAQIDKLLENDEESAQKARKLYDYIKNLDNTKSYSVFSYSTQLNSGAVVEQYSADDMFFKEMNISLCEGVSFCDYDNDNEELIPMIVGYNLKDMYSVGNTYEEYDSFGEKNRKYIVIGVLDKGSIMPSVFNIGDSLNLDNSIFQPILEENLTSFATLDMAISSTVVFVENESDVLKIQEESKKLDLFDMNYQNINENIADYASTLKDALKWRIIMIICMLCFTGFSMIISLLNLFEKKKKAYAIHMICGATRNNVISRFALYAAIIFLPGAIVLSIYSKFNTSCMETYLFGLILILLSIIPNVVKLYRIDLAEMKLQGELYEENY